MREIENLYLEARGQLLYFWLDRYTWFLWEKFSRIATCVEKLIVLICQNNPHPIDQNGEVVAFKRLSNSDNELLSKHSIKELYDRIRMVDGLDYPRAFINYGNHKIEFLEAYLDGNHLLAKVKIVSKI